MTTRGRRPNSPSARRFLALRKLLTAGSRREHDLIHWFALAVLGLGVFGTTTKR